MPANNLSIIVLTRNHTIRKELKDSLDFAGEVIIKEHHDLEDYALARNQSLKKARGEWVLFVDDDEQITPQLQREIMRAITSKIFSAYRLRRIDSFLGRSLRHGENGAVKIIRLAKRNAGEFVRPVHEIWSVKGRVGELSSPLIHFPHKSISSFLAKLNNYSTLEASYRASYGVRSSLFHIIFYPPAKFFQNYFLRLGFLDGAPGTIMAVMMSFHSYLTWTKLYLMQTKATKASYG